MFLTHCALPVVTYWMITNPYCMFLTTKMVVGNSCVVKTILKKLQGWFPWQKF